MTHIKDTLNLKYEAYTFLTRIIRAIPRYHESLDHSTKQAIDAIYDDASALMKTLFTGKEMIQTLFSDFSDILLIQNALPFFDHFLNPGKFDTAHDALNDYISTLYEDVTGTRPDPDLTVFQRIDAIETTAHEKWLLMNLYENADKTYVLYEAVMASVIEYLKPKLAIFDTDLQHFSDEWHAIEQKDSLVNYFNAVFNFKMLDNDLKIYPSVIGMNQGVFYSQNIFLGIYLNDQVIVKQTMTFEHACRIFKLLGDPTKAAILKLLIHNRMYGKELANELSLTSATISYHMQELLNEKLISVYEGEGTNRIYYQLHNKTLLDALKFTEDLFK